MKPQDRKHQTATQVKVLSPEITLIIEADVVHKSEGNKIDFAMVRNLFLYRGLSPQYGVEWKSQKLGRSKQFSRERIFANNLKKKESGNDCLEVGLLRIRGVIGVMPYENSNVHSKGAAVVWRGEGRYDPNKELG
jgi:hypothetical protein